jgi:hypothetical protein
MKESGTKNTLNARGITEFFMVESVGLGQILEGMGFHSKSESLVFTSCARLTSTPLRVWVRGRRLTTTSCGGQSSSRLATRADQLRGQSVTEEVGNPRGGQPSWAHDVPDGRLDRGSNNSRSICRR